MEEPLQEMGVSGLEFVVERGGDKRTSCLVITVDRKNFINKSSNSRQKGGTLVFGGPSSLLVKV